MSYNKRTIFKRIGRPMDKTPLTDHQKERLIDIAKASGNPCLKLIADAVFTRDSQEQWDNFMDGPQEEANESDVRQWEAFCDWTSSTELVCQEGGKYKSHNVCKKIFTREYLDWTEWYASEDGQGDEELNRMPKSPVVLIMEIKDEPF